ncbi:MAG: AAA family ATPase [Bacilli bacterium]|nr:AAA family ATPase [Bacilli bacterium]MBQ9833716.1 AAA family ATPase [Bacilli bacterium]
MKNLNYDKEMQKYFEGNRNLYHQLKILDAKKNEIRELQAKYGSLNKPIVITISGTPRAGKTTCVENLAEFFKKCDLRTSVLEEPAGLIYATLKNREEKKILLQDRIGFVERQYEVGTQSIKSKIEENDILICDRGNIDPFIWYDMYYHMGMIDKSRYFEFLKLLQEKRNYIELFYALYTRSNISMIRDYINSLSIEPRTTMNAENVERYNEALMRMYQIIGIEKEESMLIDTSDKERMDASIIIANDVLKRIKALY